MQARPDSVSAGTVGALAERIGYRFADPALLELALRHRSWVAEQPAAPPAPGVGRHEPPESNELTGRRHERPESNERPGRRHERPESKEPTGRRHERPQSNERLEFLGDAVLAVIVSEHLYAGYPTLAVGEVAKIRASVVSAEALAALAARLELGECLLLGKGEEAAGGRRRRSILADAAEALIGAVYLDGGWPAARRLVLAHLGERISEVAQSPGGDDYKTLLQERVQQETAGVPTYHLSHTGPDHERVYRATVRVAGTERGTGEGRTKKQAEQQAARAALAAG